MIKIGKIQKQIVKIEESVEILQYRLNERLNELEDAYSSLNNMVIMCFIYIFIDKYFI